MKLGAEDKQKVRWLGALVVIAGTALVTGFSFASFWRLATSGRG